MNCDHCQGGSRHAVKREASNDEKEIIGIILRAVKDFGGRFGLGKISLVLAGAKRAEIVDWGLDRSNHFGALKHLKQNNIMIFMKSLEKSGHLERVGDPKYPRIGISYLGRDALRDADKVILDFSELKIDKPPVKKKEPKARREYSNTDVLNDIWGEEAEIIDNDLYERLRILRKEMADARNVPVVSGASPMPH